MNYEELNRTRRSVLNFTGEVVARGKIEEIVAEAILAPSASNLQPWRFVVAQGAALDKIMPALTEANRKRIKNAGTAVVVFSDPNTVEEKESSIKFYSGGFATRQEFAIRNASLVTMNFMLAAWDKGVATRPMIGFDPCLMRQGAGVPRHWIPVVTIATGYADLSQAMPDRSRKPAGDVTIFLE